MLDSDVMSRGEAWIERKCSELVCVCVCVCSYYWNFEIPFYKSIRVTGQLPASYTGAPYNIYSIVRGQVDV